ncbi:16S rRNA (guanine(966)-N(2))-methyltransferase RsmD [Mycoplasma sp. 4463]|uniref:16S rRNA (guanine(966)-N(2))-methyltransferase RsmD n=1 Tax=Mycoplasma sp. 4463 TaxID=3400998 RepID=UPI003AAC4F9C
MRIIAGKLRHLIIEQPDSKFTRPTGDKVREAVFSSIQFEIEDTTCLDLFSGSGAWAIEAISRGAKHVDAVEKQRQVFTVTRANVAKTKTDNQISLFNDDALHFLSKTSKTYDFIFIDAPFVEYELVNNSLLIISQKSLLNENGEIILETDKPNLIVLPNNLQVYKEKQYGKVYILKICLK